MEKERTVIHIEWKNGKEPKHEYFSSPSALYYEHDDKEIGISRPSFNNLICRQRKEGAPLEFQSTSCIIRKGVLKTNERKE